MYTNAQKLSAVLTKWIEPAITQIGTGKLMSIPALAAIQNKVISTGWVSPTWSMSAELSPIINRIGGRIVEPVINAYISQYPDKDLPTIAHSIVDAAIEQGQLVMLEGNMTFDINDLRNLKQLLQYNLPIDSVRPYTVKTSPKEDGGECPSE